MLVVDVVNGEMGIYGYVCLRGGTLVDFCCLFIMLFRCCTLVGLGVSGEIICSLVYYWLGMGRVMLTRTEGAIMMVGAAGANVMGGVITLGKDGAPLEVRKFVVVVLLWEPAVVVG